MPVFFSEKFEIEDKIKELGVFDVLLDKDSHYFINIKKLKETSVPEFSESYKKIHCFFTNVGSLLLQADGPKHKCYRTALGMFKFPELKGINLGYSPTNKGTGFTGKTAEMTVKDAFEMIKAGSSDPVLFELMGLFAADVGPDRISDMLGNLIKYDIECYTKNRIKELGITPEKFPNEKFEDGLIYNDYKKCNLLLLPVEILHELPIAREWEEVEEAYRKSLIIKQEINKEIGDSWKDLTTTDRKRKLKENIFMNNESFSKLVHDYNTSVVSDFDYSSDFEYVAQKTFRELKKDLKISNDLTSFQASLKMLEDFKHQVEYNGISNIIYDYCEIKPARAEKAVQELLFLSMVEYCKNNNFSIDRETDNGRGQIDFKISRGSDKTVIEIKLSSNQKVLHGFNVQIEEYSKSERTSNKIFLLIDAKDRKRTVDELRAEHKRRVDNNESPASIIFIDSNKKASASKHTVSEVTESRYSSLIT